MSPAPDVARVLARLDRLYELGGGQGANRTAGSEAESAACALVAGWMEEAGLDVERDGFGNVIGRRHGKQPDLPEVWSGSHVDSVPSGGRYDGALGVVAALDAVVAVAAPERTLAVVAFRDEERGCFGSRALVERGALPGGFVELHVEQGPVLERARAPLGIVTAIVGSTRREVVFEGRGGHAGTTPMAARVDALVGAAEYVLRVREIASRIDGVVATVGRLEVVPNVPNVIPSRVALTVDARASDGDALLDLLDALELEPTIDLAPALLDPSIRAVLREEVARRALPLVELPSGAGHDAGVLAAAGVETGMLFVRSLNGGISHSPDELSSREDIALALDVLTATLARLAV